MSRELYPRHCLGPEPEFETQDTVGMKLLGWMLWPNQKLVYWLRPKVWPNKCPKCLTQFSEWFYWPGRGCYCWPCYIETGRIITRKQAKGEAMSKAKGEKVDYDKCKGI